ncbi:MAG: hypothetical protein ABIP64_13410 [Burkholderiales bacterium]
MPKLVLNVILLLLPFIWGCTANTIIRSKIEKSDPDKCNFHAHGDLAYFAKHGADECTHYSIEDHKDYTLGVVEFDDQGWLYNRRQMDRLMEELEAQTSDGSDLSIFIYVHGWKHNAEFCDNNVCCFRETLKQMNVLEDKYEVEYKNHGWKRRKVFGIYVGWRGLSLRGPDFIRSLSFYSRKNAATRIALGSTRELLGKIKDFYERKNAPLGNELSRKSTKQLPMQTDAETNRNPAGTRLLTVGHSFGGLVVYTAVAQALMESAIEPKPFEGEQLVKPFGDLVFIVNPAFEGSRFEPLHQIAKHRDYAPYQPPVFIAVTSESDQATRTAFPAGRWANYVWDNYSAGQDGDKVDHLAEQQKEANVRTIGHTLRYRTHRLEYTPSKVSEAQVNKKQVNVGECGCPYRSGINELFANANMAQENAEWKRDAAENVVGGHRQPNWIRRYASDGNTLRHEPNDPNNGPDNPFWVVYADEKIIADHNGFYTPLFLNFVRHTYDDSLHLWRLAKEPPPVK